MKCHENGAWRRIYSLKCLFLCKKKNENLGANTHLQAFGEKKATENFFLKDKETKIIEFNKHKNQNYIQEGP